MDFLKEILSEATYNQVKAELDAFNGNEANKDKQIKLANLASGEYVGKGKYDSEIEKLNNLISGKDTEIANANQLIAELKKASKGNEDMQAKFTQYEQQNVQLQQQLKDAEIKYAFEVMLMDAGCTDKDEREFLTYKYQSKMKDEGKNLELDENKHIKSADSIVDSLKTMRPKAFESASDNKDGYKVLEPNKLPGGDHSKVTPTKDEFRSMGYEQRLALKQANEQVYKQLAKN